jgi:hypothetical protein
MPTTDLPFIPGVPTDQALPLGRFLPPLPEGTVTGWLKRQVPAGGWVLDPLGATPSLALEAARAGYRVLVVSNNPVVTFMLETLASAPSPADFQSALAALASSKRGEERLEVHVANLYQTACASCGERVQAETFLWRREEEAPYAKIYHCPRCGDEGEHPLDEADLRRLALPGNESLHRARALARVTDPGDEYYPAVKEALDSYLSRPLYILTTLINKQEGLAVTPTQRRLLQALLVSACDAASTLWPWPGGRARPRQLTVPPQFRENNLWMAMEEAVAAWSDQPSIVPLFHWPELPPPGGGICLHPGRVKSLLPLPENLPLSAILTVFPRPNQAFWTLSAMWSGWLWGREASLPLHPTLGRRRFDWNWHAGAIHSPLHTLAHSFAPGAQAAPLVGLLPEVAPGFLGAVMCAAEGAGYHLESLSLDSEDEMAQALWQPAPLTGHGPLAGPMATAAGQAESERVFQTAVEEHLAERAEPAGYLTVYAAGAAALARAGLLPAPAAQLPGDVLTRLQALVARVFANRKLLRRFEGASHEDERSQWWLVPTPQGTGLVTPPENLDHPLADRVEMEVVRQVQKNPGISLHDLHGALCQAFPGLLTPPRELIQAVLESYAEEIPGSPGRPGRRPPGQVWRLLAQEDPSSRRADLDEARRMLREIGERMGYTVSGETPLVWTPSSYGQVYFFYIMASSLVGRYVLITPPAPVRQCVMVFPGGRARLLSYKLRRNPLLAEAIGGWHLLKFRHLRNLSERTDLTPELWDNLIDADPPFFEEATQMALL